MNVGIGFYVKNGKVVGRAMDAMVSGNIYDDFFRISAIGNELEYNPQAFSPDIMIDGVSVSGRD
jgi:PmbA protein